MNEIIAKAEELGGLIAESERLTALNAARGAADGDAELQADLKALDELGRKIAGLEKEVKPVEPEDKRQLRDLQARITGNPSLQKLARVEADFAELMNRVNKAIQGRFAKPPPGEKQGE